LTTAIRFCRKSSWLCTWNYRCTPRFN